MIRSILILTYIVAVLLASGLARAEYAPVTKAGYDEKNYMLHIQGTFANLCQHSPRAKVVESLREETREVIYLAVETEQKQNVLCAQQVNGQFDMVFDIRSLNLPTNKNLVLKFKNAAPQVNALEAFIQHEAFVDMSAVEMEGTLLQAGLLGFDRQPDYMVVGEDGSAAYLKTLVDLSGYLNQRVHISGLPLNAVVAPVDDVTDLNYETKKKAESNLGLIFVNEISSVPLQ